MRRILRDALWLVRQRMIRRCYDRDFDAILEIVNDGARAYKGVIPEDRGTETYMSRDQLHHEIDDGVVFWGYQEKRALNGVMGIQPVQDVTLIRHAYIRSSAQNRGIGTQLLSHLRKLTDELKAVLFAKADRPYRGRPEKPASEEILESAGASD